ncbi:MAG: hypothetical protein ACK5O8_09630 [Pirellula sp.]|jgi:hypothetical protein
MDSISANSITKRRNRREQRAIFGLGLIFGYILLLGLPAQRLSAQESIGNGLRKLTSGNLTLITDLPIDQELKSWPDVLHQAIERWDQVWTVPAERKQSLQLTAFLIGDKSIFQSAGYLDGVPEFDDGYQLADRIFVMEQPSEYYRRHLFLHEATHWIMFQYFGGAGSPWFMEGMADMFATHRWADGKLTLGVIPSDPREVPHWGRFKRLREMVQRGEAPTLASVLRFGNQRENRIDRYVWSWAACFFFWNHPEYQRAIADAASPPLNYSMDLSNRLRMSLADRWAIVEADWNGFITEFDFGFDPQRSMIALGEHPHLGIASISGQPIELSIQADHGWQDSGLFLERGESVQIQANGQWVISTVDPASPWKASAQGVTYRYYRNQPMGRLVATIASIRGGDKTSIWNIIPVGEATTIQATEDGVLLLKTNEPAGKLLDNSGELTVTLGKPL